LGCGCLGGLSEGKRYMSGGVEREVIWGGGKGLCSNDILRFLAAGSAGRAAFVKDCLSTRDIRGFVAFFSSWSGCWGGFTGAG
jgi:hypothetical protein